MQTELSKLNSVDGFITFISVDEDGKKIPYVLVLDETTDEEEL